MGELARTIAVIDDDLRVVESIVNLLASYGYSAEGYDSAEQFLDADGNCLGVSALLLTLRCRS
jgi:FixJ family two-component response regulator